jgi:hypothetical protein
MQICIYCLVNMLETKAFISTQHMLLLNELRSLVSMKNILSCICYWNNILFSIAFNADTKLWHTCAMLSECETLIIIIIYDSIRRGIYYTLFKTDYFVFKTIWRKSDKGIVVVDKLE